MSGPRVIHSRITGINRLRNTANGNPRWRYHLATGSVIATAPDCSFALSVTGEFDPEASYLITLDYEGLCILDVEEVDAASSHGGVAHGVRRPYRPRGSGPEPMRSYRLDDDAYRRAQRRVADERGTALAALVSDLVTAYAHGFDLNRVAGDATALHEYGVRR